jgi:hypothetical protein
MIIAAALPLLGCGRCGDAQPDSNLEVGGDRPVAAAVDASTPAAPCPGSGGEGTAAAGDGIDSGAVAVTPGPDDCWVPGDIVELQLEDRGFPVEGLRFEGPECDDELEAAVERGDLPGVRRMIEEVRIPDHWPARSPRCRTDQLGNLLHLGAASGSTQVTEYLISKGAAVRGCDHRGATPLHVAAANLDLPMARLLVQKGALVDAVDIEGRRPLDRCFDNRFLRPPRPEIDPAHSRAADELAAWLRARSELGRATKIGSTTR